VATVFPQRASSHVYERHRPETTTLYEVVRDNLETLYGAIDDGAIAARIPKHARKELEAYLRRRARTGRSRSTYAPTP
jgi:hypothetical protein